MEGERVPFERVLAHHLDIVGRLRATSGLTWRSMASFLARAGARRADGSQISADQLRVSYARLARQADFAKRLNTSTAMNSGWVCEKHPYQPPRLPKGSVASNLESLNPVFAPP